MTNIILAICCILVGFLLGRYLQKRCLRQKEFYSDLRRYRSALALNIGGKQLELAKFNEDFAKSCSATFSEYLFGKSSLLAGRRKKEVDEFFAGLNSSGGEELKNHLQFFEGQISASFAETEQQAKKASIYVKLGLLIGAMVGILFL